MKVRLLVASVVFLFCSPALLIAQDEAVSIQSLSSMIDQMNSLWQTFQEPLVSPERADKVAEQIINLRHESGMLSHEQLAQAFALRGWRELSDGEINRAREIFASAIKLDPYSREIRIGSASVEFSSSPLAVFNYIPRYIEGIIVSFQTHAGRYILLTDLLVWLGVAAIAFFAFWLIFSYITYLPLVHFTLAELFSSLFVSELAGVIALLVLGIPFAFSGFIWLAFLLLYALTWAFQSPRMRIISILAVLFCAIGISALDTANFMAKGLTLPDVRAAFTAETYDSNRATVAALKSQLKQDGVISGISVSSDLTRKQRLDLFLYAFGMRKLGMSNDDGILVENLFQMLNRNDSLGRRALVNWGNIRLEKDDLRAATQAYQSVLQSNEFSEAFALYNLSQLNFSLGNTGVAQDLLSTLGSNWGDELAAFNINNINIKPQLIDAALTNEEIEYLISLGLANATGKSGEQQSTALQIFIDRLTSSHSLWLLYTLIMMILAWALLRNFGISGYCSSCGKRISKNSDLDPANSKTCQSCNSLKALSDSKDADLRRKQKQRIASHKKRVGLIKLIAIVLFPPAIAAFNNKAVSLFSILSLWSLAIATIFSMDKLPRIEALPFFSHWSVMTIGLVIIFWAGSAAWALVIYLQSREGNYGTQR